MRFLKSYGFRWFAGGFLFGAVVPPLALFYDALITLIPGMLVSQPVVIVTNITIETASGKVIRSRGSDIALILMASGFFFGLVGVTIGAVKREVSNRMRR
jgi:hypothetical protein